MALRPDIILQARAPDLGAVRQAGREAAQDRLMQQREQREAAQAPLRNRLLEQQAELGDVKIQQAKAALAQIPQSQIEAAQQQEMNSLAQGYLDIKPFISDANPNIPAAQRMLARRYEDILQRGGDPSDTLEAMQMLGSGDPAQLEELRVLGERAVQQSQGTPSEKFSATTTTLDDGTTIQMTSSGRRIVTDPSGNVLEGAAAAKAISDAKEFGVDIQRKRSLARVEGKGEAARVEAAIDQGVDAAQGMAILKRSLGLLDEVKTGGFAATALKAKQFFGIEGADEAELSANLGRSVLSQLKTVFGAQFTEKEGERLERIEASFGKSAAGNRRLLQQTLKLAERSAKRGIDAAIEREDYRAAQDIKELMDFNLSDEELSGQFAPAQQEQASPAAQQFQQTANDSIEDLVNKYAD